MSKMAADMYYESVKRNPKRVEAQIGLKKNGQMALTKMLGEFNKAYFDDDVKTAVYKYIEAKEFEAKIESLGTDLNFPEHYQEKYEDAKTQYLELRYNDASLLLDDEKFKQAEAIFNEIQKIQPDYYDVDELKKVAHCEPLYRKANNYMLDGKYRSAYYEYNTIIRKYQEYKDVAFKKEDALKEATITIAVLPFKRNGRKNHGIERTIQNKVTGKLANLQNPFIKILEWENKNLITKTQLAALENNDTGENFIETGKLLGAKTFLVGKVENTYIHHGKLKAEEKKGYIKEIKKINKNGTVVEKADYHKVKYKEYHQENKVSITLSFRLISTETGEILLSKNYTTTEKDNVHYASFSGDKKKLIPGHWEKEKGKSPKDVINDNHSDIRHLQRLLKASTSLKSTETLIQEAINELVNKTVTNIDKYDPEKY
jgi:tetratricopeptide (TPR) repeat protein